MSDTEHTYKILILSSHLNRNGLLALLQKEPNYRIQTTDSGVVALEAVRTQPLDLIILDWDASDFRAADVIIQARSLDADMPIIVIADTAQREDLRLWNLGVDDCLLRPLGPNELLKRIAYALNIRRLKLRCRELTRENKQLFELAVTDGLTKLINRRHFNERLAREFQRVKRFGGNLGLLMLDIDHFKKVNDVYGHLAGDRILVEVARIIQDALRSIDMAGRYGGEEFVILLPETSHNGAAFVAEKLRSRIENQSFRAAAGDDLAQGVEVPDHITISIGAACMPNVNVNHPEDLVNLADTALYNAKQKGRNRVEMAAIES
ncbi:MAG: diguanylate cyclase [Calditrichaeota bacterium]|nr:diguanylate cyclase [Calditrichota bacterium]